MDTITNTLPVCRERGIAYCTFTIIQIFESGDVYIVEFDNPELIVLRRGQVLQVPGRERVINGKIIHEKRFKAIPEDTFVAFSDGAVHAGVGHVLNLGWQRPNIVEQSLVRVGNQHVYLLMLKDITLEERQRESRLEFSNNAALIAQNVIDKQMRVAQEIASLLGETTAETKLALNKLKKSILSEMSEGGV